MLVVGPRLLQDFLPLQHLYLILEAFIVTEPPLRAFRQLDLEWSAGPLIAERSEEIELGLRACRLSDEGALMSELTRAFWRSSYHALDGGLRVEYQDPRTRCILQIECCHENMVNSFLRSM